MKQIGWSALVAFVLASSPLYALVGIGGHWAPALGTKISGDQSSVSLLDGKLSGNFVREKAVIEQGFGLKFWLELPFFGLNIEATTNFQGGTYGAYLTYQDTDGKEQKLPLNFDMGFPLLEEAEPLFGMMRTDISVSYRLVDINPIFFRIQAYVGAGPTWNYVTRPLTAGMAEEVVDALLSSNPTRPDPDVLSKGLKKVYGDPDSGMGGHILLGARVTVLAFSIYVNGKYYLGGLPRGIDDGVTLEIGGGLGI